MVRACNANTQEVGAGGFQIHLQLHSEFQASQGHIRTCRKEKEEKRESSTDEWTIWCSSQVVSGSIQFHSLYKEKVCPGINVPTFQQTPLVCHAPPSCPQYLASLRHCGNLKAKTTQGMFKVLAAASVGLLSPSGSSVVSTPWFLSCSGGIRPFQICL